MKKNKNKLVRVLLVITVIGLAGVALWFFTRPKPSTTAVTPKTTEETKTVTTASDNLSKPTATTNASGDTTAAASSSTLAAVINSPVNGDTIKLADGLSFRSMITGATTGTCTLTLTGPNSQQITKNMNFTYQNNYSSCNVNISSGELEVGDWKLELVAKSGSNSVTAKIAKVTVQ